MLNLATMEMYLLEHEAYHLAQQHNKFLGECHVVMEFHRHAYGEMLHRRAFIF